MYVRTRSVLRREISDRRQQQPEIAELRDGYIRTKYGIVNFSQLIDQYLGSLVKEDQCTGLLCRHIASTTLESLACYFVCNNLGLSPAAVELTCDGFQLGKNQEKLSLLKQLWIHRSAKGNLVSCYRKPCHQKQHLSCLEHRPFKDIATDDGLPLVSLHHQYRQQVFGENNYPYLDASVFFRACLASAAFKPETVFVQCADGYESEVNYNRLEQCQKEATRDEFTVMNVRNQPKVVDRNLEGKIRPPAKWYYPLYLCLFLDGNFVLLESFDDPSLDNKVPEIFRRTMEEIKRVVGFQSLIVEVPCSGEMNHYPQNIIERGLSHAAVSINGEDDLSVLFRQTTEALCNNL